jgi:ring-1,2-phenylacetyl-CoA epoxidase subunit PaaD
MILADIQVENLKSLISEIPDPEIPVITIADLGILRSIENHDGKIIVTITPTYSGCPAMKAIENEITSVLKQHSIDRFEIKYTFAPAWTTDWMNDAAKEKLRAYGIAPPEKSSSDKSVLSLHQKIKNCPRCGSTDTEMISAFGSTACKSLYRCKNCGEPFDYFKCH